MQLPSLLIQCVFQAFAWLERRNTSRGNFDGYTGLWIATRSGSTLTNQERAEADQRNGVGLSKGIRDGFQSCLKRTAGRGLGDIGSFGNTIDQFRLVHCTGFLCG